MSICELRSEGRKASCPSMSHRVYSLEQVLSLFLPFLLVNICCLSVHAINIRKKDILCNNIKVSYYCSCNGNTKAELFQIQAQQNSP